MMNMATSHLNIPPSSRRITHVYLSKCEGQYDLIDIRVGFLALIVSQTVQFYIGGIALNTPSPGVHTRHNIYLFTNVKITV